MSAASGMAPAQRAPDVAHDPIAIAALIAELPDLESGLAVAESRVKDAEADAKAWRDKVNAHQKRIDAAFQALRSKAPKTTAWGGSPSVEDIQQRLHLAQKLAQQNAHRLYEQIQHAEQMARVAPPPSIKKGGPSW